MKRILIVLSIGCAMFSCSSGRQTANVTAVPLDEPTYRQDARLNEMDEEDRRYYRSVMGAGSGESYAGFGRGSRLKRLNGKPDRTTQPGYFGTGTEDNGGTYGIQNESLPENTAD